MLEVMYSAVKIDAKAKLWEEAQNEETSPQRLTVLADHDDFNIKTRIAYNPNTPVEGLEKLITGSIIVREKVAIRPNLPLHIQHRLRLDVDEGVRAGLAGNSTIDPNVCELLYNDQDMYVCVGLGHNKQTPVEIVRKLAQHPLADVVRSVTRRKGLPTDLVHMLASHENSHVRQLIAHHPSITLKQLFLMIDKDVQQQSFDARDNASVRILDNPNVTSELVSKIFETYKKTGGLPFYLQVARQRLCPPELQLQIFYSNRKVANHLYALYVSPDWKQKMVNFVKKYYPEVNETMPFEWLEALTKTVISTGNEQS